MAFMDELLIGTASVTPEAPEVELVTDSPFEPVSLVELKAAIKLPSGTSEDTDLASTITAARQYIEAYLGRCLITQTWKQTQNSADRIYKLRRYPVLSVVSIKYVANWEDDTQITVPSTGYIVTKDRVASRSTWPSHRGFQSWETIFKVGLYNVTDANDEAQITAARTAIPFNIRRALLQLLGHLYENREGQGPISKYEIAQKISGNMPPNVALLLEPFFRRSLV